MIRAVNASTVTDVATLRHALDGLAPGDAVVLQVERGTGLEFVSFEMN